MPVLPLVMTLAIAFAVAVGASWAAIRIGLVLGIADKPGGRRKHRVITSRLGAIPLFAGFTVAAFAGRAVGVPTTDPNEATRFTGLIAGGVVIFVLAVLDDRFELPPAPQFAVQAVAAGIAIASLIFIERFRNPLINVEVRLDFWLTATLTVLWFLGMMNTVNFLDGVDGVAASVALVAASMALIHMLREGQYSVALLPAALIGTLLGFLVFNFQPARLFLGGGALYLGFALACIGIIAGAKIALIMLVMGLPIADVAWQMLDRMRRGHSPTRGDRGHLHLRLADLGWQPWRIVALYAGACVLLGGAALITQPPLFKMITLGALFALVFAVLWRLARAPR
jgi:UDP-GlcNAc:undecaprenyl-phosphate/decaprenyl-phosphate GlcNAc-1-phosphate transferase